MSTQLYAISILLFIFVQLDALENKEGEMDMSNDLDE